MRPNAGDLRCKGDVASKPSHTWSFKPGMRAGAYSWRFSSKAIERLKSAKTEILSLARKDPVTAAEGVIALAQRIWPAFEHIDTSSGALGSVVNRMLEDLLPILRDDDSVVLIVGGHPGDAEARKGKHRTPKSRAFWKRLYEGNKVTEHFTLDGGLSSRHGAGWSGDVFVIKGRIRSKKFLPMKEAPMLYGAWG